MPDLALALFGGGLIAWATGEAALTSTDRPAPSTLALPTGLLVLAGHLAGVLEHLGDGRSPGWAIAAGGGLFAVGIGLRWWSMVALGPAFATAPSSSRNCSLAEYVAMPDQDDAVRAYWERLRG